MKPPVTLDALLDEWSKDAIVDETEPSRALLDIPKLHAKYLRILANHKLISKKVATDYATMKNIKIAYYRGDLNNADDLARYKLEPWLGGNLKNDYQRFVDSDTDLNNLLLKKVLHEEIAEACEAILKELHSRTFQLKSFIDYERFISGQ